MPRPALRTRSFRRLKRRTPKGKATVHYEQRRPGEARCAACKKPLHGIARLRPIRMKKSTGHERKVSRPFGGNLCSACSRLAIKERLFGRQGSA